MNPHLDELISLCRHPKIQERRKGDYDCIVCGKDLTFKVRIQNDVKGYVRCLGCEYVCPTPEIAVAKAIIAKEEP